ncbi:MAG: YkgJ family cysteine cluster protein [Marinifilaceae bacterium]
MKAEAERKIAQYRELRNEIDNLSEKLGKLHEDEMSCKKGCSECCMNFNILPIEYYSMLEELRMENPIQAQEQDDDAEDCAFLKNDLCSIYAARPVICRTHGLPLLFMSESGENWELSCCPLNFTDFDEFHEQNTYPQDLYNSKLFLLNKEFIHHFEEKEFGEFDLLPMSRLVKELQEHSIA